MEVQGTYFATTTLINRIFPIFSPTKVGGLFSGVKSQMSGWLPTVSMPTMSMPTMPAMPSIPGLRKHQEEGAPLSEEEAAAAAAAAAEAQVAEDAAAAGGGDDEDKSRYHGARYVGAKQDTGSERERGRQGREEGHFLHSECAHFNERKKKVNDLVFV